MKKMTLTIHIQVSVCPKVFMCLYKTPRSGVDRLCNYIFSIIIDWQTFPHAKPCWWLHYPCKIWAFQLLQIFTSAWYCQTFSFTPALLVIMMTRCGSYLHFPGYWVGYIFISLLAIAFFVWVTYLFEVLLIFLLSFL